MSQFHSKAQRKKVMRLIKEKRKYDKQALKKFRTTGLKEKDEKLIQKARNLSDQDHDVFMKKAFFKGDKGEVKHIMIPSSKINGEQYYTSSVLSPTKHRKYY